MKSRVVNSFRAFGQRLPRGFYRRLSSLSQTGIALGGAVCVLTLSGCYYPYGYYPGAYSPYYATVPAGATQQDLGVAQNDPAAIQQQQQLQAQQAQSQARSAQQLPPATYATAVVPPPPVYVAPAYPAYYPPPVYPAYPAYYGGYPGWYGPSVSIGFGFGGYWGGRGGWGGGGHGHWH
ncbi:hypothetical protein [Paraburkholderia bryophila]|uniref:Uncharacterized protein n=1 Tax=Paraburkholderia bryophila TaxID=420952 RepID=A0A7Z0AY02_9BURK|nr:hypothetical protein [Paraburkholderia bryophila]NYH13010.1 hypothetical protein [Paraburkholderia bryophila]